MNFRILLNHTAFEEGFKIFVQSKVDLQEEWWNELKEYLYHNLQGEIGFERKRCGKCCITFSNSKDENRTTTTVSTITIINSRSIFTIDRTANNRNFRKSTESSIKWQGLAILRP